jgi:DNA-binding response OmpR family regulator
MDLLIADDDEAIRRGLALVFAEEGYAIHQAANGVQALAFLATHPGPVILLLDRMMPKLTGDQVLLTIAHDPALAQKCAIALVTVNVSKSIETLRKLILRFEVIVVRKPFDLNEIIATARILQRRLEQRSTYAPAAPPENPNRDDATA